jgi:hypothetical protein
VVSFSSSVPVTVRKKVVEIAGYYCQMCGISLGDVDERTGRYAKFRADWVANNGLSFRSEFPDLRILCSTCYRGASEIWKEKLSAGWLVAQIGRAGTDEQRLVFEWLLTKFKE